MSNNTELREIAIPLGWNALVNHEKKTVLFMGNYTTDKCKANTRLELITRQTEAEVKAYATEKGYEIKYPNLSKK